MYDWKLEHHVYKTGTRKQLDSETCKEKKEKEKKRGKGGEVRINHLARMVGMNIMTFFIYFSFFLVNKNLVSKSKF